MDKIKPICDAAKKLVDAVEQNSPWGSDPSNPVKKAYDDLESVLDNTPVAELRPK